MIDVGHKLQRRTLYDTRRDVQLEHIFALKVRPFQRTIRLTWIITLLRNMQHLEWNIHRGVKFVSKIFLAFMRFDNTKQASVDIRLNQLILTWITCLKLTTQTSRKNSKHVNISLLTQLENGKHRVFNFATSTFDNYLINKKLHLVFKVLKCVARVNLAFVLDLKNVEDESCRCFYAHENNKVMERPKIVCVRQTTLPSWKRNYRKSILFIFVQEREPIPNGRFTNWQIWQFL